MANPVQAAREQAARLTQAAYEKAAAAGLLPAGQEIKGAVDAPRDGKNGDFASSFAMAGARALHMPPRRIARIILDRLELDGTLFRRAEIAGPGFLNFFCAPRWYGEVLGAVEQLLPAPPVSGGALPASLAEARRRAWEDALSNLLRRAGAEAISAPADVGPVLPLREGRPIPGGERAQAGEDALRFFLTLRPIAQPVELDVDLAARQDGGSPLYRVQYAHARICSLVANLAEDGVRAPACADTDPALLCAGEERSLIKALARYPEAFRLAVRDYDPSRVSRYLIALAGDFRRFYSACRLRGDDTALQAARLKLADCTRLVLADGLGLLGVSAPVRM